VLLKDVAGELARLKAQEAKDFSVVGSGGLVRTLMEHGLVDEYVLFLHPLVLGRGNRLFEHGVPRSRLDLVDTKTTTTGVLVLTYRPARS
jgi:dihydrofolate reductase